jgi:hypothetical protein
MIFLTTFEVSNRTSRLAARETKFFGPFMGRVSASPEPEMGFRFLC